MRKRGEDPVMFRLAFCNGTETLQLLCLTNSALEPKSAHSLGAELEKSMLCSLASGFSAQTLHDHSRLVLAVVI